VSAADLELLAAWRSGDNKAGNELVKRHFEDVYGFFRNKLDGDVDDLIQATFLACVESRDRFRGESSFRTYLFTIARHELYATFRTRGKARADFATQSVDELLGPETGASTVLQVRAERLLLLRALRRVPLDDQIALELYYWKGLPGREIAEILDLPENTVRTRLRRARLRLEEEVRQLSDDAALLESTLDNFERWAGSLREQLDL